MALTEWPTVCGCAINKLLTQSHSTTHHHA